MPNGLAGLPKWAGSVGCGKVLPLSIYFLFDSFSFFICFLFTDLNSNLNSLCFVGLNLDLIKMGSNTITRLLKSFC
jgi:hypothetical protein